MLILVVFCLVAPQGANWHVLIEKSDVCSKKKKVVPPVRNCSPVCTAVTSLVCCFVHEAASKPILSTQISKLLNPISRENVLKKSEYQFTYVFKVCHSHMWWVDLYFSRQMNKPRFRVNDRDL